MAGLVPSGPPVRWDPSQYERYGGLRLRPAVDLLARIHGQSPARIWDLGCGAGGPTRMLAERWPEARIHGLDQSAEMLERAAGERSDIRWVEGDLAHWRAPEPVELIFSNAALHWVPDHGTYLPGLVDSLVPGGVLAVQMPFSFDLPSHRLLRASLKTPGPDGRPFGSEALQARMARRWVHDLVEYRRILAPFVRELDLWIYEYAQRLEGPDAVLEWVRGTLLRPVFEELQGERRKVFSRHYRERLTEAYPTDSDGRTPFPFPRLFLVARR